MDRVALLLFLTVVGLVAATAGPALADHGGRSNYTVVPHDSDPGDLDATYQQHATAPITFDRLDYIAATWSAGGFTGCGPTNTEVFGIDRGNDRPGTGVDEDLTQYVEEATAGEDRFEADFYERDDAIGTSTSLRAGDEFVALVNDCFDNPDRSGWYRITASIGGTAPNGSYVEATYVSHYFPVCECASRQEARARLGPPPSAQTPAETPTATADPTPTPTPPEEGTSVASPTPTSSTDRSTATLTDDPEKADWNATGSRSAQGSGDGSESRSAGEPNEVSSAPTPTPSPSPVNQPTHTHRTPTVGSGPGFGPAVAVVAVAIATLLVGRA